MGGFKDDQSVVLQKSYPTNRCQIYRHIAYRPFQRTILHKSQRREGGRGGTGTQRRLGHVALANKGDGSGRSSAGLNYCAPVGGRLCQSHCFLAGLAYHSHLSSVWRSLPQVEPLHSRQSYPNILRVHINENVFGWTHVGKLAPQSAASRFCGHRQSALVQCKLNGVISTTAPQKTTHFFRHLKT